MIWVDQTAFSNHTDLFQLRPNQIFDTSLDSGVPKAVDFSNHILEVIPTLQQEINRHSSVHPVWYYRILVDHGRINKFMVLGSVGRYSDRQASSMVKSKRSGLDYL